MDVLSLARLQFGTTAGIHFMFVTLTLGLAPLVAIMETRFLLSGNPVHERMTRFWGLIYVTNYAVGIFTGLIMEFQFGLVWSGLTHFMGNVFGGPLALETLMAFFAESTFLGMWIFGWNYLPRGVHVSLIWLVTATAYLSAFWILTDNAFMQHPVGYAIQNGVAHLTDFGTVIANSNLWLAFGHIVGGALIAGGVVMAGVSALHIWRRTDEVEFFRRSVRMGVVACAIGLVPSLFYGIEQFAFIATQQRPTLDKLFNDPLIDFGGTFMMYVWVALLIVTIPALFMLGQEKLARGRRRWLMLYLLAIPFPLLSTVGGWIFREVGRQPWVMYHVLTTSQALGPVSLTTVTISYISFTTLLVILAAVDYLLIARIARRGPSLDLFGASVEPEPEPSIGGPSLEVGRS